MKMDEAGDEGERRRALLYVASIAAVIIIQQGVLLLPRSGAEIRKEGKG